MRKTLTILLSLIIPSIGLAQSLQISASSGNNSTLKGDLSGDQILILENGKRINSGEYSAMGDDPSFKVYPLQNGSYIVRENIANFVLFDSFGSIIRPISNSSQSQDGEKISELAMDPMGKTVVLYNPQIRNGNKRGSQAKVVGLEGADRNIFYREDQEINAVRVSESGQFIAIGYGKEGEDNSVLVMDKFGNEIEEFVFDRTITGINLYGSGSTLTVYSEGRVAVFNVLTGERIGSSSFRNGNLIFANYSSSDQSIVGLSGDVRGNTLSNIEVRIINVDARKIASEEYSGSVQIMDMNSITLNRTGRFSYTISGLSENLNLKASF